MYLFLDAPKLLTNVRTFTGSRNIDVLLQCSSIANPPAAIVWLDENKQEIDNPQHYKIKTINQSSTLSFSIVGDRHFIEKKTIENSLISVSTRTFIRCFLLSK